MPTVIQTTGLTKAETIDAIRQDLADIRDAVCQSCNTPELHSQAFCAFEDLADHLADLVQAAL